MNFPANYTVALDEAQISIHFPNLQPEHNFKFTSLQTDEYNCVSWADENSSEWTQFYNEDGSLIRAAERYILHFEELGYNIIENAEAEEGMIKIAIYLDSNNYHFKHVARQLISGKWTSKLGDWEDIEHDSPETLLGKSYGNQLVIMGKRKLE